MPKPHGIMNFNGLAQCAPWQLSSVFSPELNGTKPQFKFAFGAYVKYDHVVLICGGYQDSENPNVLADDCWYQDMDPGR